MIPSLLIDSLLRTGFKDLSIARHREAEAGPSAEGAEITNQGDLLEIASSNLNNDFEHECLNLAVRRLGASPLPGAEGDMGPHVFGVPGIPKGRFLPHQVWGIWFLVERVVGNSPPVALLADDMGLGKTFTALGALLHMKWISSEAALGRRLACLEDRTVSELGDDVPPFFGSEREVFNRPAVVMVPANLMGQWETAINGLSEGTPYALINLNANISLTSANLNYEPEFPERGHAIHLVSYPTYRTRYAKNLAGCRWSIGLFDESHSVRSPGTLTYRTLVNADVRAKIQLTGTPMYNDVFSWVVQAEWLFAKIEHDERGEHGPEKLREVLAGVKTGTIGMEEAYGLLRTIAHPWMIRRWAETKGANGEPLVALAKHVFHDVRLRYTKMEGDRLQGYIKELKEKKHGHVATVIHEWRLACLSMDLPGGDIVAGPGGESHYRQSWDPENFHAGPAIRWLADELVPILLGEPANGSPNKVVIFLPLPGQVWFVYWYLQTFHTQAGLRPFIFHADLTREKRNEEINNFSTVDSPAALILTPTLGGTGLNLVAANHVVIMQKCWVLNEQRQAIGRIDRLGQMRTPTVWILHCEGSVDDRAEELHKSRAVYEARIIHGLIGESFSYKDLVSACAARRRQMDTAAVAREEKTPGGSPTPGPAPREETPASDG